jgi:hypothetical protein
MQHGMAMLMNPVRPLMVATRDQQGDLKGTGIFFFFSLHFFMKNSYVAGMSFCYERTATGVCPAFHSDMAVASFHHGPNSQPYSQPINFSLARLKLKDRRQFFHKIVAYVLYLKP